jgi:hypothetical protein
MATQQEEILEVIRNMPGCSMGEIKELVSFGSDSVSSRLTTLKAKGMVRHEGKKYYPGDGKPPIPKKLQAKAPIATMSMRTELDELRAWKAAAIAKYPDLGVSPELKAAREAAIAYYKKIGDNNRANSVKAGELDNTPVIQVALLAASQ